MTLINLDVYVQAVWAAKTLDQKRHAFEALIEIAAGKKSKAEARKKIMYLSAKQLDSYAVNFAFSGDGMKVN